MHQTSIPRALLGLVLATITASVVAAECPEPAAPKPGPYPTAALADYVMGCMIADGKNPDTLRKCSCSIDFIAAALPYKDYERVETLMRMQQMEGTGRNAVYKGAAWAKDAVGHFKEIQAESTLQCF